MSPPRRTRIAPHVNLLPFLAVAAFGMFTLAGWWAQEVSWVQPRPYDPPLPANAALCFVLLGAAPVLAAWRCRKSAGTVALLAAGLGWMAVANAVTSTDLGLDNLLVRHEAVLDGVRVGRINPGLGIIFAALGLLLAWCALSHRFVRRPLILALAGSLTAAYGATGVLANRIGLARVESWRLQAQIGLPAALALLVLGGGVVWLASHDSAEPRGAAGPRWLWLPVVVGGTTVTVLFWVSLQARELAYRNNTTQLTINTIATLYSNETENQIEDLTRMAARWSGSGAGSPAEQQRDARALYRTFPAYRMISLVSANLHTRWLWPREGNEDAESFDHASDPVRRRAMDAAQHAPFAVAGPLRSPVQPPAFAVYATIFRDGRVDGFLVGEFSYQPLFAIIDRRLNISDRYRLVASVWDSSSAGNADLVVYNPGPPEDDADPRLTQTATFNVFAQRLSFQLSPRAGFGERGRNLLPELALASGLGVSALLGLVVNLAQAAHRRQRAAEDTSEKLRDENEERRRAEDALRTSQSATRLLTHVARRTANVVFITTPAGNIEWTNDSFTRLTGYATSEVTGVYLLDLLSSSDNAPEALDEITRALLKVEPITSEVVAKSRLNDQSYHLRLELQPVKDDRGLAENFIVIGTDITTSVQTETTLRRAKTEADAASRAKSEFLATMSHEIRTPMNGVIGMTSLLLETELTPEQRECVNTIRTSGSALLGIINEILDFSKIESGRMELDLQPFEIVQCVEEALDIFILQAAAKNIELAYRVDPAVPPWILLDMTRVRQVLVNLLNNAVKFTVQGQITVEVCPAMVPNADRSLPAVPHREDGRMMIDFFVRDTGIGIPADRRHLLFKPFSQVDSSTTRKYGGTGLGLAICDRLCHLMGGTIDVADNPGGGSVFRFGIFAAPVDVPGGTVPGTLPERYRGAPVLVVDDLPFNRVLLRQALARLQLTAVEAAHLHDATAIAMEQPIVAAIIDNDLLGETGVTLAEELHARHPEMPVVLLTNPIESAKQAGRADAYLARLPKPIKPGLVLDFIRRRLGGQTTTPFSNLSSFPSGSSVAPFLAESMPLDVLVVEDNPVNQKVALRSLERLGYRADAVGNGLEALDTLDQRKFDLVFMDLQMPEMDGLTATREIRLRYPKHRQPRIIALTANAVQGDRDRCLAAGMDDYITKPVKLEQLQQIILKYFRAPASG